MNNKGKIKIAESKGGGYILLHRKLFDNKYYFAQSFTKSSAWIDLLLLANHKQSYFEIRGIGVPVNRGQLAYSQKTLAQRWRWSINRVKRYLHGLKMDAQIDYQNTNVTTLITILNYDTYQNMNPQTNPQTQTKRKPNGLHTKNEKNDNKDISECFSADFKPIIEKWLSYKSETNKPYKSQQSINAMAEDLLKLSNNNPVKAMKIVDQSIKNNWAGLFQLGEEKKANNKERPDPTVSVGNQVAREAAIKAGII